jgi:hypothetical protein
MPSQKRRIPTLPCAAGQTELRYLPALHSFEGVSLMQNNFEEHCMKYQLRVRYPYWVMPLFTAVTLGAAQIGKTPGASSAAF